jgi:hypothetical protein
MDTIGDQGDRTHYSSKGNFGSGQEDIAQTTPQSNSLDLFLFSFKFILHLILTKYQISLMF